MCLALLLSCYGASGYYASDDYTYLSSILNLVQNGQFEASLGGVRYPLILPGALVYYLTGSLILTTCFGVIYHPLLVLIAYRLGCLIDKRELGIVTACLAAVLPGYYLYSGTLLPDVTQSFWTALWLYFLIQVPSTPSLRQKTVFICAAGFCNGLAYLTKESGLLLTVPSAIFLFFSTSGPLLQRVRIVGIYCVAIASFFVLEILLIKLLSGEWLWRLGVIGKEEHVNSYIQRMARQGYTIPQRLHYCYEKLRYVYGPFSLLITGSAFALYPFLPKKSWLVWGSTIWLFLYLTVGTTSLSQYLPPTIQERYYAPLLLMAALVVSQALLSIIATIHTVLSKFLTTAHPTQGALNIFILVACMWTWGFIRALAIDEDIGAVYRARETRAFLSALNFYGDEFQSTPIVLSSYLSRRMEPILKGSDSAVATFLRKGEGEPHPGQSFFFLRNASSGTRMPPFEWLKNQTDKSPLVCTRKFSSARTRLADLIERFRELLLIIRPREDYQTTDTRDMFLQYIITKPERVFDSPWLASSKWNCEKLKFEEPAN